MRRHEHSLALKWKDFNYKVLLDRIDIKMGIDFSSVNIKIINLIFYSNNGSKNHNYYVQVSA